MDTITYILKEMWVEKTRFLLIILAIAWGTVSIAGMLAVGEGLRLTFGRAMAGSGNALLIIAGGQTTTTYRGQNINQSVRLTNQDLVNIKRSIPNIQITPEYNLQTQLNFKDKHVSTSINAVAPIYNKLRNITPQLGGRFINPLDIQNHKQVIFLGNDLADQLFTKTVNPLENYVIIDQKKFQVIGVMKKKLQLWFYSAPDSYSAWIPASTYIGLARPNYFNNLVLAPKDPEQLSLIKQEIRKLIALNHHLDPNDNNIVQFSDSYEVQKKTRQIFTGMEIFLGFVGSLTLIVSGVGIANVMFMSIKQATREIGIRMAVGARDYQILFHYMLESLLTTVIGGLLGLLVAKMIISVVALIPVKQEFFQFIGTPKPIFSLLIIWIVIFALGATGLFAGLFPAKKAAQINPAEALRYE